MPTKEEEARWKAMYESPNPPATASPMDQALAAWDNDRELYETSQGGKADQYKSLFPGAPPNSAPMAPHSDTPVPENVKRMLQDFYGGPPPVAQTHLGQLAAQADDEKERKLQASGRAPTGIFTGIIDILSRAQYAEVAVIDELATGEFGVKALGSALTRGLQEFVVPRDRLSFVDLIGKYAPEFAEKNPIATMIAGTAADVALDPTTWLSFGVGGAGKAVKVTSKVGETLYLTTKGAEKLRQITQLSQRMMADELIGHASKFNWAEEQIVKLAMSDPALTFKKGFQAHITVPFVDKHLATVLSPEAAQKLADSTGLTAIRNFVKTLSDNSNMIQSIKGTFRRVGDLPPEYLKLANQFMSVAENASEEVIKATAKMAKGITPDGARAIGRAAHGISDDIMAISRNAAPGDEFGITEDLIRKVQERWFAQERLGEKEINVYSQMRRALTEMRQAENLAGLEIREIAEYFPRQYRNIEKTSSGVDQVYRAKRFSTRMGASESRVFETIKDAQEAGFNPEWNAVKSFAMRAVASRKAVAKKQFDDALEAMIKRENFSGKIVDLIRNDAREIGDSVHPNFDKYWLNALVNSHDFIINSVFRPSATILKPGFATFQALSNTVQMMWAGGFTMGARAGLGIAGDVIDAVGSGFGGKYWESMRKTLWNFDPHGPKIDSALILKYLDEPSKLRGSRITTDIGTSYTGEEIAMMIRDMRIAQGTSVLGVPGFKKTATGELMRLNAIAAVSDKTGVSEGFLDFMSGAASYWNWPRMVEDMARTNFFMNALRQGHSPHEAMKLVNKALYDYTGGLSKFERQWVKRVIPFYSFARFTLPLAADVATTKPGRLLNTSRGMKMFFGAWNKIQGGEQLNDAERHSIPGWILEQPSTFAKFGLDGRAHFNAFTNWTPLDALSFMEPGDSERSAVEKTVQKTVLSMMTPVIKLPLEHAMNRNFFTGRVLKDATRIKDRLGNNSTLWQVMDKVLPEEVKKAMSWEIATDVRTGKESVYINPYLAHYATGIMPVMNTFIRMFDSDLTPTERAMWTIGNVSTYKIDMRQQYKLLRTARKTAIADKKRQIKYLRSKGMDATAEEYMFELKQLMMDIRHDAQEETEAPRGPGNFPGGGQ